MSYTVWDVSAHDIVLEETMGTKDKGWIEPENGQRWLFKYARVNNGVCTGEDWSEKIAYELALRLSVQVSIHELAIRDDQRGILTFDMRCKEVLPAKEPREWSVNGSLVHGNEILSSLSSGGYPKSAKGKIKEHQVDTVLDTLARENYVCSNFHGDNDQLVSAADEFVGHIMLDALIGNTDRHHQNWGVIATNDDEGIYKLSSSYDHASSMGRNLTEEQFCQRLKSSDVNQSVEKYIEKTKSGFSLPGPTVNLLSPLSVFEIAAEKFPIAALYWMENLNRLEESVICEIVQNVPQTHMGECAKEFVTSFILLNRSRLLKVDINA